jgi:hypothetical protein
MAKIIDFDWLENDEVMSSVTFDENNNPTIINYTDDVMKQFLGKQECTVDNILDELGERCFPETRHDKKILLRMLGLSTYDPYSICRVTDGKMMKDNFWIRWKDKT